MRIKNMTNVMIPMLKKLLGIVICRFALGIIAQIIPKKANYVLFFGSKGGKFVDNVKYAYLYAHSHQKKLRCKFVTWDKCLYSELIANELPVLYIYTFEAIFELLRANIAVFDDSIGRIGAARYLIVGAQKIQLWHGAGFKKIDKPSRPLVKIMDDWLRISENSIKYDLLVSTSAFYSREVFCKAFSARDILNSGYPRNDQFFEKNNFDMLEKYLIGTDEKNIDKIIGLRDQGYKVVVYVPTFRDVNVIGSRLSAKELERIVEFCVSEKIVLVYKGHYLGGTFDISDLQAAAQHHENIIVYEASADIYPVFAHTDCMLTDYSSIYTDYLLLGKPVVFFPYDYDNYISQCRDLQFDYQKMTPGPKVRDINSLIHELKIALFGEDTFGEQRREVSNIVFDNIDGDASKRIVEKMSRMAKLHLGRR